jgi:hypothetical protein
MLQGLDSRPTFFNLLPRLPTYWHKSCITKVRLALQSPFSKVNTLGENSIHIRDIWN